MSSKLPLVFFVTLWVWLPVVLITHTAGKVTNRPGAALLQGTHLPPSTLQPTPTIDRLAAPPTVENPTQADEGAQLFWLYCQPCHGDRGQGLTDEWRAQYPPDHQNCWTSGCHGRQPYEEGFTLPTAVPAVTGEESLERFETMEQVYGYVSSAMPYEAPGHLSEEEYLAITAFLARAHDIWDGTPLNTANISNFRLRPAPATSPPEPRPLPPSTIENVDNNENNPEPGGSTSFNTFIIGIAAGIIGSLIIIAFLIKQRT